MAKKASNAKAANALAGVSIVQQSANMSKNGKPSFIYGTKFVTIGGLTDEGNVILIADKSREVHFVWGLYAKDERDILWVYVSTKTKVAAKGYIKTILQNPVGFSNVIEALDGRDWAIRELYSGTKSQCKAFARELKVAGKVYVNQPKRTEKSKGYVNEERSQVSIAYQMLAELKVYVRQNGADDVTFIDENAMQLLVNGVSYDTVLALVKKEYGIVGLYD